MSHPDLDAAALKRRVLLTGLLALVLFLAVAWTIAWLGVSDAWLVLAVVALYLCVVRPLMAPVREAIRLRRRMAYQAWLDDKHRQEQTGRKSER